ncbi:MAG: glycosyltransferase [Flammeovirgaceae bacterium]|nr:glycosyltransferase [Flammeovirgaceae bacterium]
MDRKFNVLVAPLNWGLGHSTRCIPIIKGLLDRQCQVVIASDGDALLVLKREFPNLNYTTLPSYKATYSSGQWTFIKILGQLPKFLFAIRKEHQVIEHLTAQQSFDLIISDNRYGCWSSKVQSIFLTHQLKIQVPRSMGWAKGIINFFNRRMINRFSRCWVPDYNGEESLSGKLSEVINEGTVYIGPISRFQNDIPQKITYDYLCIVSGPEPQRTIFEDIIRRDFIKSGKRCALVRGKPILNAINKIKNIDEFDYLPAEELNHLILQSDLIISRSGYTTIMDLHRLGKKAIFIPTPGQTEQEYLAWRFRKKRIAYSMNQSDFNLSLAIENSIGYSGFTARHDNLLSNELDNFFLKHGKQ